MPHVRARARERRLERRLRILERCLERHLRILERCLEQRATGRATGAASLRATS